MKEMKVLENSNVKKQKTKPVGDSDPDSKTLKHHKLDIVILNNQKKKIFYLIEVPYIFDLRNERKEKDIDNHNDLR